MRHCACLLFHNFQTNGAKVIEFRVIFISRNYVKISNDFLTIGLHKNS
jgi:hypothetical protein